MKVLHKVKTTKKHVYDFYISSYLNLSFKVCSTHAYPISIELGFGLITFNFDIVRLPNTK